MPNPRNLNYVLGSLGQTLQDLEMKWEEKIPPIQCIVVNKRDGLPGEGINWFVKDADTFSELPSRKQQDIIDGIVTTVSAYNKWDEVLDTLGLEPVHDDLSAVVDSAGSSRPGKAESKGRRRLKEYVAHHPGVVGLPLSAGPGDMEVVLPSGDQVDACRLPHYLAQPELKYSGETGASPRNSDASVCS